MAETVKRLKINKLLASQPCMHCGDELLLGEAGAVCEACESPHHERCWDEKNGCGNKECINAPLAMLPGMLQPLRPGESRCPSCGDIIDNQFCLRCNAPTIGEGYSTSGAYVTTRASEVGEAIGYAIIGLFCVGFILGFLAIRSGSKAKEHIALDPRLDGAGLATFAQGLGAFEIVAAVIIFLRVFSGRPY
ncbi:MAG TPA: RING finger protein [Pyrinomonadaceae bacterium]|nr:RING finger protein [Pyrinomonadaceae bacterium]